MTTDDGVHPLAMHLIKSRLRPPRPLLELVRRDRLLEQLSASTVPLVVLAAPGGFGKTITLSQWAESDQRPIAWLQADEADDDLLVFLHYLVTALGGVAPVDPRVATWLQAAPPPVAARILPALTAAVQDCSPFVFVVDDAHLLANQACWQILGTIVEQLPPQTQLCLSGRTSPPMPLARMRVDGRLLEVGPRELALSRTETQELLQLHGVAADLETVAYVERVTEGWAAGVYLAALAGARLSPAEWPAGIHGHHRDFARYLGGEVLERERTDVAEFLLQTSILERLSPGLCRAVTGNERAGNLLRAVARNNLFVSALDDADEWFRYHHLFAEFLQAELLSRDEAATAELHGRAAAWFEDHDCLEEAVRHWLAAGEPGPAGNIVCRAHMDRALSASWETVRRWLDWFTDEQIFDDEALTLTAGFIGTLAVDSARGLVWRRAALRMQVGDGMWPGAPVSLRAVQAGLRAALAPEGITQMLRDSQLHDSLGKDANLIERARAVLLHGFACWLAGDNEAALDNLCEAEEIGAVANILAQISACSLQALILADEGRWAEARGKIDVARERFDEAGLSWNFTTLPLLVALARLEAREGCPRDADRVALIWTTLSQGSVPRHFALLYEVLVGETLVEQGDLAGATRWMQAAFAHLRSMPDAGILRPRLLRLRDALEQRQLLEPLTPAERRVLVRLPTELSLREIAWRSHVSVETVRTQVRDIYRKLGVHTRTEAVARARELGLLGTS